MIPSLKTYPMLEGYRGAPPGDVAALEDLLVRLGRMADDLPQIAELDFNPVMVQQHGAVIVDARVRIAATAPVLPPGARR